MRDRTRAVHVCAQVLSSMEEVRSEVRGRNQGQSHELSIEPAGFGTGRSQIDLSLSIRVGLCAERWRGNVTTWCWCSAPVFYVALQTVLYC